MKRNVRTSTLALALSALVGNLSCATPAEAGSFTNTGSMAVPRYYYHTATLLQNGEVLVAGGLNYQTNQAGNWLSSAELYNPVTGTWRTTSSMSIPRRLHTATLLPDGKVLVAGGEPSGTDFQEGTSSAELYDPATETWRATRAMSAARRYHMAALLPSGKVLIMGGNMNHGYTTLAAAELYDPETETWAPTGAMTTPRAATTAVLLGTGKVLVAAGYAPGDLSTAELYDPSTGRWTRTGSLSIAIDDPRVVLLANGKVLVAGGYSHSYGLGLSTAEIYDPSTGLWTATSPMSTWRANHSGTLLPSGLVLVAGGITVGGVCATSAELYDPVEGTWTLTGRINTVRESHTATRLNDGRVLLVGGDNESGVLSSAELYDATFKITSQPQSQVGYWGKSVSFSVSVADGAPPYSYQWLKDEVQIPDATNSLLLLTNLQFTNAGVYTVVVSDTTTNLTSQSATLDVKPAGVSIALYAGVTIDGVVGQTYGVQSTLDLSNTNSWVGRANVTLTSATQLWYDSQPASQPQRYYRVVPGPISVP